MRDERYKKEKTNRIKEMFPEGPAYLLNLII